jgi:poly(A) polymerase
MTVYTRQTQYSVKIMKSAKIPSLANEAWFTDRRFRAVMDALADAGGEARAVGGCVRDALLGVPVGDVDIATDLAPKDVCKAGESAGLGVHPTGIDHGTVSLVAGPDGDRKVFEVTTLRVDVETYGRHARVAFTSDWAADARRRDFTMNALYCDARGMVHDMVDGYDDIVSRTVRFVGKPENRIHEDYLRILRFYRFHASIGEGMPDTGGRSACRKAKTGLDELSRERVRQEFFKLLCAPGAAETVRLMEDDGVLAHVLASSPSFSNLEKLIAIATQNQIFCGAVFRLAALFPEMDTSDARKALVLTNEELRRLKNLTLAPTVSPRFRLPELDRLLYWFGNETIIHATLLAWVNSPSEPNDENWRNVLKRAQNWLRPQFPLTGNDLRDVGIEQGPELGKQLQALEDWWVAAEFQPNRAALLNRLISTK